MREMRLANNFFNAARKDEVKEYQKQYNIDNKEEIAIVKKNGLKTIKKK